jgi:hypothetical protein
VKVPRALFSGGPAKAICGVRSGIASTTRRSPPVRPVRIDKSPAPVSVNRCSRKSWRWFSGIGRATRPGPGVTDTSPCPATRITSVDFTGARRRCSPAARSIIKGGMRV